MDTLKERYGEYTAPYAVAKNKGLVVDAALTRSAASHANHDSRRPNCRFAVSNDNKVVIIATRNIRNGEQILLNYNKGSGPKYLFDEPGVSHTTTRSRLNAMTLADTDNPSITDAVAPTTDQQTTLYECIDPSNPDYHQRSRRPITHEPPRVQYSEEQRSQMFIQCHSNKPWGAGKTWITLNTHYPGHGIPFSRVQTLVAEYPKCQKYRISDSGLVIAPKRTVLQPPDPWNTVSLDGLPISPPDMHGNNHVHISKEMGSNFILFYAASAKTEATAADAIFTHRAVLGPFDYLQTDPGSDYTSGVVAQVNAFLGVHHHIGLVGRPQSTGIERDVQEVKRFIRELCNSHTLQEHWSLPRILAVAQFLINEDPNENSEFSLADLKFGRRDTAMLDIISKADPEEPAAQRKSSHHRRLLAELLEIRSIWSRLKAEWALDKTAPNLLAPQNMYQKGDLVFKTLTKFGRDNTFAPRRLGPYEVILQQGNDFSVTNLVDDSPRSFHVTECVLFAGSRDDAVHLARHDNNQWSITAVTGWRGDPDVRGSLAVRVLFDTGESVWMLHSSDVTESTQFHLYCEQHPPLQQLTLTRAAANKVTTALNRSPITLVLGQQVLLDIRFLSHLAYQLRSYNIPDKYDTRYVIPAVVSKVNKTKVDLSIALLGTRTKPLVIDVMTYLACKSGVRWPKKNLCGQAETSSMPGTRFGSLETASEVFLKVGVRVVVSAMLS